MSSLADRRTLQKSNDNKVVIPQYWKHGLCDCCQDPGLCCKVLICQPNATGQSYQRATGKGCIGISVFLWTMFILSQILTQTSSSITNGSLDLETDDIMFISSILGGIAGLIGLISTIAGTYFICTSRRVMRERDRIENGICGDLDDCCVSYWCACCSLIQMFRQDDIRSVNYTPCNQDPLIQIV